jgi:hypothetical protein
MNVPVEEKMKRAIVVLLVAVFLLISVKANTVGHLLSRAMMALSQIF